MIANSGHDERGKYSGGQAGDQSGNEWQIQKWYSRPWNYVLRYPRKDAADMIATLAEEAARNNKIGYDQAERTTFWKQLKASGYRPANITVPCEADCSAGVAAIVKATGYLLNIDELKAVSADMYTGNEKMILVNAGFSCYGDSEITGSDVWLRRGDILLYEHHHTAINLTDGKNIKDPEYRWVHYVGKWYYQDKDGRNAHGWRNIKETAGDKVHRYWFDSKGAAATGQKKIDGKWYSFMSEGDLECALCVTDADKALQVWSE